MLSVAHLPAALLADAVLVSVPTLHTTQGALPLLCFLASQPELPPPTQEPHTDH